MNIIGYILTRNNAKLLDKTLKKIPNCINDYFISDDNSSDKIEELCLQRKVKIFRNYAKINGYGSNVKNALKIAFNEFKADYAVEIHGDGAQFNPIATYEAIKIINSSKSDLIIGSRFLELKKNIELKYPLSRMVPNYVISKIERILLNIDISDFHSGFRIYSKEFFDSFCKY